MSDSNGEVSATESGGCVGSPNMNTIILNPDNKKICYEIAGENVTIVTNAGSHDHGSSQVKLKNIVDYKWEVRHYPGHLIAVHLDGQYSAYVINVHNRGMVRVVNEEFGQRALIKGMIGEVLDLQFAHIENKHILASIDVNSLFVHNMKATEKSFECNLMLKIDDPLKNYTPKFDKVSWCPYVDVSDVDDEASQLLVWSRGSKFQCFNVSTIVSEHPMANQIKALDINAGCVGFFDKAMTITWVALSPDGSTLGVGSSDGVIRFYQVYMHDPDPRCLHQWKPHGGQPISSFFFLDDLKNNVSDTYWKYAITGAVNNCELKVWDCGTWECLQTINIVQSKDDKKIGYKAELDRSAGYLVLTSQETRTICVFQVVNNTLNNAKGSDEESKLKNKLNLSTTGPKGEVYIKSIAEFPLNSSILSCSIVEAGLRRYKSTSDNYTCEELDEYDDDASDLYWVMLRLFVVQQRSMQDCRIQYQPNLPLLALDGALSNDKIGSSAGEVVSDKADSILATSGAGEQVSCGAIPKAKKITASDEIAEIENGKNFTDDTNEQNTLESLLGIAASQRSGSENSHKNATTSGVRESNSEQDDSPSTSPLSTASSFAQVNLMTPDAFSTTTNDKKTPDCVSSEVLNTIRMLASVAGPNTAATKSDNISLSLLVNNTTIEDQEQLKIQMKQTIESQKNFIAIDNNLDRNTVENLASGGSSPSREVQEIMSLHDYDKSPYSGDELLEDSVIKTDDVPNAIPDNIEIVPANDVDATAPAKTQPLPTNWPKVPDVHKVITKHSAELQNAANLISHVAPPTLVASIDGQSADFTKVNLKIDQLIDLVKVQSMQINSLQTEIADMKKTKPVAAAPNMQELSTKIETQCVKLLEQSFKRYEMEYKKKINAFISTRDNQNRELREHITKTINQNVVAQLGEVVAQIFGFEIHRRIGPLVDTKLEKMKEELQVDMAQRFATFNQALEDNINQLCKNKTVIETFGKAVLEGVQGSFQTTFIDLMSDTLIPAYEKSSRIMFQQLHDAFSAGIKEFVEQFNQYLHLLQPIQSNSQEMLNQVSCFRQSFEVVLNKNCNTINENVLETRKDVKTQEILLSRIIQESVRTEVRRCLESQVATMRSQTTTPAPIYDLREGIKLLLNQGQYNKAFHQALLANDLSLVEYTLKNADHHAVFHNPTCCLEQKVILSLIQQISADMSHHNDLKQNFLSDAVMAINSRDPISNEHAPKVLQELYRNSQAFLLNFPKSKMCSNVRMLIKLIEGFKDQF